VNTAACGAGFIGLGNAGEPMALRILSAGLPLAVYDIDPVPVSRVVQHGASAAESARDLAADCDFIAVKVSAERQLEVVLGSGAESGLLGAAAPEP
jgi:3-hydroxyisobutyrate dehydrogenase